MDVFCLSVFSSLLNLKSELYPYARTKEKLIAGNNTLLEAEKKIN